MGKAQSWENTANTKWQNSGARGQRSEARGRERNQEQVDCFGVCSVENSRNESDLNPEFSGECLEKLAAVGGFGSNFP